jgi:hypothetical protein
VQLTADDLADVTYPDVNQAAILQQKFMEERLDQPRAVKPFAHGPLFFIGDYLYEYGVEWPAGK